MLLVCIRGYMKLVLTYKNLILDCNHPDILYLREEGCEEQRLFFQGKLGPASKKVWETVL